MRGRAKAKGVLSRRDRLSAKIGEHAVSFINHSVGIAARYSRAFGPTFSLLVSKNDLVRTGCQGEKNLPWRKLAIKSPDQARTWRIGREADWRSRRATDR